MHCVPVAIHAGIGLPGLGFPRLYAKVAHVGDRCGSPASLARAVRKEVLSRSVYEGRGLEPLLERAGSVADGARERGVQGMGGEEEKK